ncbi:MAG TPA: HIT family protein [Rhizomicrobium sp.]
MTPFALHPRLAADTSFVADWPLSRLLVLNDARYRWLVLVPRVVAAVEIFDLDAGDRIGLVEETARAAQRLSQLTGAAKINIGALGNLVPQLHVHVVARNPGDPAWPGPVWGHSPALPYEAALRDAFVAEFLKAH